MDYNQVKVRQYIIDMLIKHKIKYQIYDFKSGVSMIHVAHNDKFYAIQVEIEFVGVSLINEDNPGFDTIPDEHFFSFMSFEERFKEIFIYI